MTAHLTQVRSPMSKALLRCETLNLSFDRRRKYHAGDIVATTMSDLQTAPSVSSQDLTPTLQWPHPSVLGCAACWEIWFYHFRSSVSCSCFEDVAGPFGHAHRRSISAWPVSNGRFKQSRQSVEVIRRAAVERGFDIEAAQSTFAWTWPFLFFHELLCYTSPHAKEEAGFKCRISRPRTNEL